MYKCLKCKKEFKFNSELTKHQKRKTNCDINDKEELFCSYCKIPFSCLYNKKKHEKTQKHINTYNIQNSNVQIGNNNLQNIIQLTLNTNTFTNSNVGLVSNLSVELIYGIYENVINSKYLATFQKAVRLFKEAVIFILDRLHFNIANTENHNLKILLMFPKIEKLVYEYLILEINKESNELVWNSISYEQLLDEIFNLLLSINITNVEKHNNEVRKQNIIFDDCIAFLRLNLLEDKENKNETKREIEELLNDLYIKFNKDQKKEDREVKLNILDKINEYKNYRENECRLSNGFIPEIINSNII